MSGPVSMNQLSRNARGKRPHFFPTDGLDQAMSMILVLAEELCVVRDRLDTVEHVARDGGLADAIEAYQPDEAALQAREARRQAFLAKLYYLARKEAAELSGEDTPERFTATITDIAEGRMD